MSKNDSLGCRFVTFFATTRCLYTLKKAVNLNSVFDDYSLKKKSPFNGFYFELFPKSTTSVTEI
jgi:hypothetical protein